MTSASTAKRDAAKDSKQAKMGSSTTWAMQPPSSSKAKVPAELPPAPTPEAKKPKPPPVKPLMADPVKLQVMSVVNEIIDQIVFNYERERDFSIELEVRAVVNELIDVQRDQLLRDALSRGARLVVRTSLLPEGPRG